ncbi:MAG: ACT domain-containing protein, partial [Microcella pacifica]
MTSPLHHWIVTIVCDDRPGIVHAVTGAIVEAQGNITELQQFSGLESGRFFLRLQTETATDHGGLLDALQPVIENYGMECRVDRVGRPLRTLVLVSKAAHCLNDLLFRQ